MIVSELVAKLGFTVDGSGAKQFDSSMVTMRDRLTDFQNHINQVGNTSGAVMKGIAAGVGFAATNIAFSLASAFGRGLVSLGTNFVTAGDDLTATMNRLASATGGPDAARQAYDLLYNSARQTGVAVIDTSKAFMSFYPAMQKAGMSISDTAGLLDGLQKGMVAAGATSAITGRVLTQISQAVNANNFGGDELKSFLENASPRLIDAFAAGIGKTREELKKLGSEGKLTNKEVLPGLIRAAAVAREEFGGSATTVNLAWSAAGVAVTDFMGKLNKLLGINRLIVRVLLAVGNAFEFMGRAVDQVQRLVDSIGGLTRVFWTVTAAILANYMPALLLAIGPFAATMVGAFIALVRNLAIGFLALARNIFLAALPLAGLAAWFILIEDFIVWMRGGESLFGRKFGDFDTVVNKVKDGITQLKDYIFSFADQATEKLLSIWRNFYAGLGPASQRILGVFGLTGQEGSGQPAAPSAGQTAVGGIGNWIEQQQSQGMLGWIFDKIAKFDNAFPLPNLTGVNPTPPSAMTTANQSNTFQNQITVNATGTDGASIATAAQSGVTQANEGSLVRLGDTLARGLLMSSPRSEAAAQ